MALATQTGGSTIRPASFNGIYALKPTWGVVSREGQKFYSLLLDTLGWYGRSVADLSLMADVFSIRDDEPSGFQGVRGARFAVCRTDNWPRAGEGTRAALEKATELLRAHGATVEELTLPPSFAPLPEWHRTLLHTDGLTNFLPEHRVAKPLLHESLAVYIDLPEFSRKQQLQAQDGIAALRPQFDQIAAEYDAVLTASVVDEAPEGLDSTGDAVFCANWTVCR
jgi:amidase